MELISVAMPYWQRQSALDRTLASYRTFYPDLNLEISICDDGSPVPVKAPGCIITTLPRKDRPLNPCVPINRAVEASSGDIVVLTNPEIVHTERTLAKMLEMMETENDYIVARCFDMTTQKWLAGPEVRYDQDGRCPVPDGSHFHFCAMFHRSLWDRAGGFDEDYRYGQACDDNDWLWRVHRAGAVFKTCESVVQHYRTGVRWNLPHNRDLLAKKWGAACA